MTARSKRVEGRTCSSGPLKTRGRKQVTELGRLLSALAEVMEPDHVSAWLQKTNPAFDGSTPMEIIERGEAERIWQMIYEVQTAEPA